MGEIKLSARDEYLASFNSINEDDKQKRIEEYAKDKLNIEELEQYIEQGNSISGDRVKGLYLHYLSFCCHEKDLEMVQDQFDNIPNDIDSKEMLKRVKDLADPVIERREINYDLYHSGELDEGISKIAAKRKVSSNDMIKRLMLKADRQADREFMMVGVDLKSIRNKMKEERGSSKKEQSPRASMKKMVSEALLDERGTNYTDLKDIESEKNKREKSVQREEEAHGKD